MRKMTLKAARVNVGLDQKAAAEGLNITPKTLRSWEKGKTFPPVDKLTDICKLYRCTYDEINFLPSNPL